MRPCKDLEKFSEKWKIECGHSTCGLSVRMEKGPGSEKVDMPAKDEDFTPKKKRGTRLPLCVCGDCRHGRGLTGRWAQVDSSGTFPVMASEDPDQDSRPQVPTQEVCLRRVSGEGSLYLSFKNK